MRVMRIFDLIGFDKSYHKVEFRPNDTTHSV